jgi:hypothetical protein
MKELGAHFDAKYLQPRAHHPKYKATDSRKLGAQYIFNAELDKV